MPEHVLNWTRRNLYFAFKRMTGSSLSQRLSWLRGNQFHPVQVNQQLQNRLLSRLLLSAYQSVPFYRKRLLEAEVMDAQGQVVLENFTNIPVLTREDLREHHEFLFHWERDRFKRVRPMPSGGTTGDPVLPYVDLNYWDWCWGQTLQYYEWMGLRVGMPYLYFWGAPQDLEPASRDWKYRLLMDQIQHRKILNCRLLSEDILVGLIRDINQSPRYRHMVAYTNELYDLACFSQAHNLPITRPMSGILTTTAALTPEMRETLETVFHCPVYSRYGAREVGDVACECEFQQGHHINPLYARVEVLNDAGDAAEPGEEGRIVITMLHNTLMPLIRYEIQDLGILREPGACLCGRSWPTLSQITGRLNEKLTLAGGKTFGKPFFHYVMEPFTRLRRYQIVQHSLSRVQISLVASEPDYVAGHADEVQESYRRLLRIVGSDLEISYVQVPDVERGPSGKVKLIVKNMNISDFEPLVV